MKHKELDNFYYNEYNRAVLLHQRNTSNYNVKYGYFLKVPTTRLDVYNI